MLPALRVPDFYLEAVTSIYLLAAAIPSATYALTRIVVTYFALRTKGVDAKYRRAILQELGVGFGLRRGRDDSQPPARDD